MRDDVGEVVLALGVVVADRAQQLGDQRAVDAHDAGIAEVDRLLRRRRRPCSRRSSPARRRARSAGRRATDRAAGSPARRPRPWPCGRPRPAAAGVAVVISGASPIDHQHRPGDVPRARAAPPWPRRRCRAACCCTAVGCGAKAAGHRLGPGRDHADDPRRASARATLSSTWRTIGQPASGCSTFGSADFMRVPAPAASTTTAMGDFMAVRCHGAGRPARCAKEIACIPMPTTSSPAASTP